MNQRHFGGKRGSRCHSTTSFSVTPKWRKQDNSNVRSCIILRSRERVTTFTKANSANFSSEKW